MTRYGLALAWLCSALGILTANAAKSPQAPKPDPGWLLEAESAPKAPRSGQEVTIQARVQTNVTAVKLEYQIVDPGAYVELKDPKFQKNWISVPMQPDPSVPGQQWMQAVLPGKLQVHRRLIRYRFSALDPAGHRVLAPDPQQRSPNFAYFVYDGIPAWGGAIHPQSRDSRLSAPVTFSREAMSRVQAYHLLAKKPSVEDATWNEQNGGKEYKYTGTLVVGTEVFDHIGFRARGGVWRYAMAKNMWKFNLGPEQKLYAHDDFGERYPAAWSKVNLRACIQQGDYGHRGEQGLFESVGFRLFNLAGVPAPFTHWVQLRIIDEPQENPSDQYQGDFWGLYLAIENEDGHFLKGHGLPSGNLYKMFGMGQLEHQGADSVSDGSDIRDFMNACRRNQPDSWWGANFDLASYYSYRAICECIHHYDTGEGKNYDYFHNPKTGRWQMIPWDIDLTWADNMYGSGEDPFKHLVLSRSEFRIEYQNRLREIRDLLFNPEQTGRLIDEYASVIWDPSGKPSIVEADRRKWDYHPAMASGQKAGQGRFYEACSTRDFPGMGRLMKAYVKSRGSWIDSALLSDPKIPATPTAFFVGPTNFLINQLRFRASAYKGNDSFAALRWRVAEVPLKGSKRPSSPSRGLYEINSVWESRDLDRSEETVSIPDAVTKPGHCYRARVRMKDSTHRWSHWSDPVEFVAGEGIVTPPPAAVQRR
jgi:hypothetical protein